VDGNIIATLGSALAILLGVHTIVNRAEDRSNKRLDDVKETLRAEIKASSATLELKISQSEARLNERIETRIVRG
jgi:hypothetical protein